MTTPDPVSAAKILTSLISLSKGLISEIKDRKSADRVRQVYELTMQLQSIQATMQEKTTNLEIKIIQLEREKSDLQSKIERLSIKNHKPQSELHNFQRKTSDKGVIYLRHKVEDRIFACITCSNEKHIYYLQPDPTELADGLKMFICSSCGEGILIK